MFFCPVSLGPQDWFKLKKNGTVVLYKVQFILCLGITGGIGAKSLFNHYWISLEEVRCIAIL